MNGWRVVEQKLRRKPAPLVPAPTWIRDGRFRPPAGALDELKAPELSPEVVAAALVAEIKRAA